MFRGSVTKVDWNMDSKLFQTTPEIIEEFAGGDVGIHRGFAGEYEDCDSLFFMFVG